MNWLLGVFGFGEEAKGMHTPKQHEWMRSLRRDLIPDPAVLTGQLAGLNMQIAGNEAEFDRLDKMADSGAFLRLQPLAEQQQQLRARAAKLPAAIPDAEQKQRAFLTLAALFVGPLTQEVQSKLDSLLHDPPSEQADLDRALGELDEANRLRARVSVALRAVSSHSDFREPDDALRVLRDEWEWRVERLDRARLTVMTLELSAALDFVLCLESRDPEIDLIGHGALHAFGQSGSLRIRDRTSDEDVTPQFREQYGAERYDDYMASRCLYRQPLDTHTPCGTGASGRAHARTCGSMSDNRIVTGDLRAGAAACD